MYNLIYTVIEMLSLAYSVKRDLSIRFLKAENEMLRSRLKTQRVILTAKEKKRLLKIGAEIGHQIEGIISIVQAKAYRKWVMNFDDRKPKNSVGQPRKITQEVRNLIKRLAIENPLWGCRRISGELKKLKIMVSKSSVARIMLEMDLDPSPTESQRKKAANWSNFIKLHMNTMVACDFFCKEIKTITGSYMAYCLVFIHLKSRKIWCSPATKHPNDQWGKQQARNMTMWLGDNQIKMTHLIRDRDTKFTKGFDLIIRTEGARIVQTPIMAPNANAFMECWIGSLRKECLNHFTCFSTKHLGYIVDEYVEFYNDHRPHQGKGNQLLKYHAFEKDEPNDCNPYDRPLGRINCKSSLGGLLKHYYRAA